MDKKIIRIIAIFTVLIAVITVIFLIPGDEAGDGTMTFNGMEYTYDELVEEFGTEVSGEYTGVPLADIILASNFAELDSDSQNETLFKIEADDGWTKHVTWTDMQTGLLMEEDHMTYFPELPGAYKVKNTVTIDDVPLGPIVIYQEDASWGSATETTWEELFSELDEVDFTDKNQDMAGLEMVDVFEYAGFAAADLENATFTFVGVDNYQRTVNYTEVQSGYLIEDTMMSYFLNLTGQYRVKNIVRIIVEI